MRVICDKREDNFIFNTNLSKFLCKKLVKVSISIKKVYYLLNSHCTIDDKGSHF